MTTKALPAHGTEGRYKGTRTRPGCRCTTCIRGNRIANIHRARARAAGVDNLIDNQRIAAHITTLADSGMSYAVIGRHAGVAASTISAIANGRTRATRRDHARRILAVQPALFDDGAIRPALGYIRRVRALYAIGHNHQTIADAADLDPSTICDLAAAAHTYVRPCVTAGITAAYAALANTPGNNTRSRERATREDWASPDYWDDDDFDNPDFVPATVTSIGKHAESRIVADEIRHLASFGISEHEIARRVGRSKSYVHEQLAGRRAPGWRNQTEAAA